jgi:hypothetical protein
MTGKSYSKFLLNLPIATVSVIAVPFFFFLFLLFVFSRIKHPSLLTFVLIVVQPAPPNKGRSLKSLKKIYTIQIKVQR